MKKLSDEETRKKARKAAADKPVLERLQAIADWHNWRKPPFVTSYRGIPPKAIQWEGVSWLHRTIMAHAVKLPWWLVEWSIRKHVTAQQKDAARFSGISLKSYMDNVVKLERMKLDGYYKEG